MTCTQCYRVNPTGSAFCYNCGARLTLTSQDGAQGRAGSSWTGGEPDPWTGHDSNISAAYGTPRAPDAIYNADGTIALRPRPVGNGPAHGRGRANGVGRLLAPLAGFAVLLGKLKFLLFALAKVKILVLRHFWC